MWRRVPKGAGNTFPQPCAGGTPVTPRCLRGICLPRRGTTRGDGARGAPRPQQLPVDGMGTWVLVFGDGRGWERLCRGCTHAPGGYCGPRPAWLRPTPGTRAARSLLSVGKAARSPSGASRPPCLAQATARSPSPPDAALAPAGIQQPSPAGAPRCLPITHERCRADSSGDGKELPETLMGPRLPSAFASCPWRPQRPPHR